MGKSSGGGTQTVVNQTQLPQWAQDAAQKNLNAAYQVAGNMMGPYTGQRVADMTGNQLADINAVQNNLGSTNPSFAYAQNTAANLTNYNPAQVNAGSLAGTDLSSYMNPYTQNVINSGLQALDVQRQQALNQIGDQAIKTGAFGGSRQGVSEGITNAASAMQAGNLAAQLQAQNFAQAQAAAQNDINRNLQAQGMNQQAGLQGAGLNLTSANALGNLAAQGQNSFLQGNAAALAGQEGIQNQNQQQLNAAQQAYQEQQQFPIQQLQIPLQALGATPYGQTSTTTGPGPTQNLGLSALGGAGVGAQIGSMLFPAIAGATPFGALGGAGAGALLGLLSDERMKTDVEKLGRDPATGLNVYAYRYKGDPKSYPKVVGPMAQEVERKYPNSVREVGGKKVIGSLGFGSRAA
jgi:Chaperone of endosialidase